MDVDDVLKNLINIVPFVGNNKFKFGVMAGIEESRSRVRQMTYSVLRNMLD